MTEGLARDALLVLLVWALSRLFSDPRNPWRVLDWPNARSLHERPVPRMGGLAIVLGVLLGLTLGPWSLAWRLELLALAWALIAVASWYDDLRGLSARIRLGLHGVAAGLAVWAYPHWPLSFLPQGTMVLDGPVAFLFLVLFLVWWINLYNFMDGMDGLAGGMAVFGFGTLALLGYHAGDPSYAEVNLTVASAALGFTLTNFPPARIFMGDLGSTTLGFAAGLMILIGADRGDFPVWAGLVAFSPFWVDATVTLIRRLVRGDHLATAHREHYYQRCVRSGFSHKQTVIGEYLLMALCALCAYLSVDGPASFQWAILAFLTAIYGLLAALVGRWEALREGDGKTSH